jgi:hypothetical protein
MITDLPTPVSPLNNTLQLLATNLSNKNLNLTVSEVGTNILKYGILELYVNSYTYSFHDLNSFLWKSR